MNTRYNFIVLKNNREPNEQNYTWKCDMSKSVALLQFVSSSISQDN